MDLGYESVPEVAGRGEFARRGGIVDVFPAGQPLPVRLEWFGDEIESLRAFDPADQRGVGPLVSVALVPAGEFRLPVEADARRTLFEARLGRIVTRLPERLATDHARLVETGSLGDAAEVWSGVLAPATGVDHVGDAILVIDEPATSAPPSTALQAQADERSSELEAAGELAKGWPDAYLSPRDWKAVCTQRGRSSWLGDRRRRRAAGWQSLRLARAGPAARRHRRLGGHRHALAARGRSGRPRLGPVGAPRRSC